jgi:hypothetical protein
MSPPSEKSSILTVTGSTSGIPAKSFNVCVGVLGAPGTGKSTYGLARAIEYGRKVPAYVFAHDLGYKLPDTLPGGRPARLKRYERISDAARGMATDPGGVNCIATPDAGPVFEYASKYAAESLRRNNGNSGIPCIVLIDEIVSAADANAYRLGGGIKELLALRRHRNVGIIWTCQSPRLCHYQLMAMGTELVIFRLQHKKDLDAIEQAGIEPAVIDTIRTLPDHHYVVHACR